MQVLYPSLNVFLRKATGTVNGRVEKVRGSAIIYIAVVVDNVICRRRISGADKVRDNAAEWGTETSTLALGGRSENLEQREKAACRSYSTKFNLWTSQRRCRRSSNAFADCDESLRQGRLVEYSGDKYAVGTQSLRSLP